MALDSHALVSLAELKAMLGLTDTNATRDAQLEQAINDGTQIIEDICQQAFIARTYVEDYPWSEITGQDRIRVIDPPANFVVGLLTECRVKLRHRPVASITSIADPGGNTVVAADYVLHKSRGVIEGFFIPPLDANGRLAYYTITYLAGKFADTAALAADTGVRGVVRAAKMAAAYLFQNRDGSEWQSKTIGNLSITKANNATKSGAVYPLPPGVMALLAPYRNYAL